MRSTGLLKVSHFGWSPTYRCHGKVVIQLDKGRRIYGEYHEGEQQ